MRRLMLSLPGVVAAVVLLAAGCGGGDGAVKPGAGYAITSVAIVDVESGTVLPEQTVLVVGDRIEKVGPRSEVSVPQGSRSIDGRGLYLMPGLVDAHVHYFDPPVFGPLLIANGVVLVRDMGMPTDTILKLRDQLNRGETLGPEMIATGAMLDGSPPLIPSISIGPETPEEGRAAVVAQADAGVDMIKVYSRLDREVFLAIVAEAERQGLKVVGHVPDSMTIEAAAAAGLASSEHYHGFEQVIARLLGEPATPVGMTDAANAYLQRLGEVDPDELQAVYGRLAASGLTICPTVVTFKAFSDQSTFQTGRFPRSEYVSQTVRALWKQQWAGQGDMPEYVWQNWAKMVSRLNEAGVPLMVGTDLMLPGILPGFSVHEEMAIWQEAGIAPANVLRSATTVPAKFMGLGDRLGSVSEGKTASMVLVRANPLEDIRNAQQIEGVFLRGRYFSRDDVNQLLVEARESARQSS